MENILYFDLLSGISGDMTIASLLDLGVDQDRFLEELKKLNLAGYEIEISTVQKNGITATDFKVVLEDETHPDHVSTGNDKAAEAHHSGHHDDHDQSQDSHGHQHQAGCNGCGNHGNHGDHDHGAGEHKHSQAEHGCGDHQHQAQDQHQHNHDHRPQGAVLHSHSSDHVHRNFNDIQELINQSQLSQKVKALSIDIFAKVAEAEAKVHNKSIAEVHFHEVGAVDSIVDIVGTAILVELLNPDHIYASAVPLGTGFVDAAHGRIPIPAPATIEILKGVLVYSTGVRGELVTPTGAAIIKTLAEEFIEMPEVEIDKIAYGAGKKDFEITNLLRVYQAKKKSKEKLLILETNIDDMSGEIYSYLFPKLLEAGAKDVYLTNIMMKKNRPAQKLTVLTAAEKQKELEEIIFRETTTLGIRNQEVNRSCLERRYFDLNSSLGKVTIKAGYYEGELIKYSPEYEESKKIAEKENMGLQKVYDLLKKEAAEKLFV
ncbi:hypothetical protein C8C77_101179 [Halanaerobium saccharolyticum]|uniref:Pyridinium-3,5-bisthiocarboxylic acid mononucleotide nickel insertion protein n=1 Tax=Halanaerobium saccharolyticum TaxID=43595 RepID=A0A4R7ZBK2_9FIRM|nr:nickel pincer cofactor biosynthesis protein LarC [Halanaerobium saccharolyticum]RAK11865.1 hypothetical protein C7958_102179 [Halanaerobium saccharolyticum]TDW07706.1 hypothetical protein C8C77_101179 [Halanaerobium saccharolyticum]TDX64627.1 hypothetical protein C7956_101179 [Halanaerobium saccharolyticum]